MFEQLVVGGKVELFKKSRRIKENGETKEMLVSQIMDINDETIICTMPSRQGKMIVLEVGTLIEAFFYTGNYIYKSDCTVKSRGKEGNIFTVELRPETALVKFQRREFYRLKCTIDADIIPLTDEERKIFDVTGKLPDNFVMPEDKGIIVDVAVLVCISSSRCFVFSHVFFSGLGSCMHFPYFSGCAEVFLPNMRASLTRRLWPVNSRSRPWCTMRSMIAAASLSSAKTVPHLLNSMFVVNMMLRLS